MRCYGCDLLTGKWNRRYAELVEPRRYGDDRTYALGAFYLRDCALVEDWGCGSGWLRRYVDSARYRGVDGSLTPFADVIADLTNYRSSADGVFLRHVIEHNLEWERILQNAVLSFERKLVLILFTPLDDHTHVKSYCPEIGVPDIAFDERDITRWFGGLRWRRRTVSSDTLYGCETIYYVRRLRPDSTAS
jgi:hypothetical protein